MKKNREARSRKQEAGRHYKGAVRRLLMGLHRDERGAIAVLVLLTLWVLIAAIGLVWNNAEETYRRERMQTAADAASHAASTWMSRTVNSIAAQNMVISQDASEETIWRAVPPTDQALRAQMQSELALIIRMKSQQGLQALQQQIQNELLTIAQERQLTMDAMGELRGEPNSNYADANERARYFNLYRQSDSVREWVWNTYVQGNPPPLPMLGASPRPGPPGPNGEGLVQLMVAWQPAQNENQILDYINGYINSTEMPIIVAFEQRTAPATSQPVDVRMAQHEQQVYQNELDMMDNLPLTIEAQRAALSDYYKMDITLASLKREPGSGAAQIYAPLMPASEAVPVTNYVDSIRAAYPAETAAAGLSPVIAIDPINVHVNEARIWHPAVGAPVPAALRAQYPSLAASYAMSTNFPGGWGHIWTMPLEHYVHERVNADLQTLKNDYMGPLDTSRTGPLATTIRQMMNLPNNGTLNIAALPGALPDDQPEPNIPPLKPNDPVPPPRFDNIFVMPNIIAPVASSAEFRGLLTQYNQHAGAYTGAVQGLAGSLRSYTTFFNPFTRAFASETWETNVNKNCLLVLETLGTQKQFAVLSTYGLRNIPDWAQPGMYTNVETTIEYQVVQISMPPATKAILADLTQNDPLGLGKGYLDKQHRDAALNAGYVGQATQIADQIVRPTARQIAQRIALEWVRRPWPYEITPPSQPVPPFRGVSPDDRKHEFTVLAASRQTNDTAPGLLLTQYFGNDKTKLVAYSQAETFNWMEFNAAYGGSERYDEAVPVNEVTYVLGNGTQFHHFVGSPRGWRVDSLGGWNWRTRLSLSDALYDAVQVNDDLRAYLQDAGIPNPTRGALDEINLH